MIMPGVGQRDSAYYSVIDAEWPAVRANLEARLGRTLAPNPEPAALDGIDLRRSAAPADLDALEPAWNALQEHHVEITPSLGPDGSKRDLPEAWRIRRAKYERWLTDPETFFVIAEANGEAVGYACVTVGPPYASWDSGERLAELETLSVLPEHRGSGVGAALLEAAWKRLAERGVADMQIVTTATNFSAKRFYESQGFTHGFDVYYGKRRG
jgi:ribosomal protein S18 acetylase RimI-like enzyme